MKIHSMSAWLIGGIAGLAYGILTFLLGFLRIDGYEEIFAIIALPTMSAMYMAYAVTGGPNTEIVALPLAALFYFMVGALLGLTIGKIQSIRIRIITICILLIGVMALITSVIIQEKSRQEMLRQFHQQQAENQKDQDAIDCDKMASEVDRYRCKTKANPPKSFEECDDLPIEKKACIAWVAGSQFFGRCGIGKVGKNAECARDICTVLKEATLNSICLKKIEELTSDQ